ncbi:hypothetical protein PHLGIDRAFT_417719 [Phlebiopsis gigantea 11061_1 CR5-6]|uniref:Uncharacterized protein n=1 Tax=Phlebiopsis gigantea (strain 11061_1 CR5-6) TaxID=745531 RepID=A0A0C3P1Z3_PHLG1|nr:hypothetical protein PHLGIDRAFT_417719 [Phlebiopsis gigantea 11061_1 CR5-6]
MAWARGPSHPSIPANPPAALAGTRSQHSNPPAAPTNPASVRAWGTSKDATEFASALPDLLLTSPYRTPTRARDLRLHSDGPTPPRLPKALRACGVHLRRALRSKVRSFATPTLHTADSMFDVFISRLLGHDRANDCVSIRLFVVIDERGATSYHIIHAVEFGWYYQRGETEEKIEK